MCMAISCAPACVCAQVPGIMRVKSSDIRGRPPSTTNLYATLLLFDIILFSLEIKIVAHSCSLHSGGALSEKMMIKKAGRDSRARKNAENEIKIYKML